MDLLNVEIISKEMIKPSSPTPNHLRKLKLSFLDQISPQVYVPLIFFYRNYELNINHDEVSRLLKQSLSSILTLFYPLTGRIQQNSLIDCNDAGAEFIEARVHTRLTQVIEEPRMEELQQLLPVEPLGQTDDKAILSVKINFFNCGGTAIGVCLSHKIADGVSSVAFINAWAAACRGEAEDIQPSFDLAFHFPPKDLFGSSITPNVGVAKEKITTKRLVFDKEKLAKLKQVVASGEVKNPTRVEALSAFIWRHFIQAARTKTNTRNITSFAGVHAVNLRPRAIPPIPAHAFGNCWRPAIAILSQTEDSNYDLVTKLRYAITEIDDGYIKKLQCEDYLSNLSKWIDFFKKDIQVCNFTSWCKFPMYKVDFGWGKPVWICTTTLPFKNLVVFMSSSSEDGIEAWVNVPDDDLEMLETHYKQLNVVNSVDIDV
ncbi:Vinorine synthase [Handroanthus impetiginosus]|uniref:Vinorine synthase n=1 Tax=Handroanthus impetiginosus TaxID=429701 RepID=A0A2G9HBK3_9LAMI|nr:Vinorine synthase [Handroanthus impetiginosus]